MLVSTVGPFVRWGAPAVDAAIAAGASYLDSTGEPPFIREVFERHDAPARAAGAGLVTAFGYDFVPGNLAAALALERAGDSAVKVSVGYFVSGKVSPREAMSGGTAASLAGVAMSPAFGFHGGAIADERTAKRVRSFEFGSKRLTGVSIGSSEHFALRRSTRRCARWTPTSAGSAPPPEPCRSSRSAPRCPVSAPEWRSSGAAS